MYNGVTYNRCNSIDNYVHSWDGRNRAVFLRRQSGHRNENDISNLD